MLGFVFLVKWFEGKNRQRITFSCDMKGKPRLEGRGILVFSELLGARKITEMTVGFGDDDFISGTWHFKFAGKFWVGAIQDGRFLLIWKLY